LKEIEQGWHSLLMLEPWQQKAVSLLASTLMSSIKECSNRTGTALNKEVI
jgi:hypothetical protein